MEIHRSWKPTSLCFKISKTPELGHHLHFQNTTGPCLGPIPNAGKGLCLSSLAKPLAGPPFKPLPLAPAFSEPFSSLLGTAAKRFPRLRARQIPLAKALLAPAIPVRRAPAMLRAP